MNKVLISMPDQLTTRMKAAIPKRQRSKIIALLIEKEVEKREKALYECAMNIEKDKDLQNAMKEWDLTIQDGLADESW